MVASIHAMMQPNFRGFAPIAQSQPVASGTTVVDQQVSSTNGTWLGSPTPTFTYQWLRDGVPIDGATSNVHTCVLADVNTLLSCQVTATNSRGVSIATSNQIGPVTAS